MYFSDTQDVADCIDRQDLPINTSCKGSTMWLLDLQQPHFTHSGKKFNYIVIQGVLSKILRILICETVKQQI